MINGCLVFILSIFVSTYLHTAHCVIGVTLGCVHLKKEAAKQIQHHNSL